MKEHLIWKNGRFVGLVQVDETQTRPTYVAISNEGRVIHSFRTKLAAEHCCHGDDALRERKLPIEV
jgi:hypothetical protein